jgi:hypothetical protein
MISVTVLQLGRYPPIVVENGSTPHLADEVGKAVRSRS